MIFFIYAVIGMQVRVTIILIPLVTSSPVKAQMSRMCSGIHLAAKLLCMRAGIQLGSCRNKMAASVEGDPCRYEGLILSERKHNKS